MPKRSPRFRRPLLALLLLVGAGLAALHVRYPLPYVYRVLVYQDSDFADIHRFPARPIAASEAPNELPIVSAPGAIAALEQHPDVGELDALLAQTETAAFLVVHRGTVVLERYLLGHDRESLQNTFSVSKSVASALVGLAVRDGVVALDAPITEYLPELGRRDQRFAEITVEQLVDMRSGIRYSHESPFPFINADDPQIYYSLDLASLVLQRTTVASPPGDFQYNNYNPPLLGLILRRATGVPVATYAERELWQPMGAASAAGWTVDDHGMERMESGFHARARDLARFGQLFLDRGVAAGRQLIPESWILASTDLPEPLDLERYDGRSWGYRLGWWIVPRPRGRPDFCAIGRYGQLIYVSPQHEAVFVRTGPGRGEWGDRDWTGLFYSTAERLSD